MNSKKYKIAIVGLVIILFIISSYVFVQKIEYEKRILFWETKHAKVMYETNWIPLWEYEKENK